MESDQLLQADILKRLDIMIKIMLENRPDNPKEKSIKSQVLFLKSLNLRPSEIAAILGIQTSNVTAYIAVNKKRGVKK